MGVLSCTENLDFEDHQPKASYNTMLGTNLSDQIPGGPNLTLTLTLNSN